MNRTDLKKTLLVCFVTPILHAVMLNMFFLGLYRAIGFNDFFIAPTRVLGCLPEVWMTPVVYFSGIAYFGLFAWASLKYSKKGFDTQTYTAVLLGAFLFYPVANFVFFHVLHLTFGGGDLFGFMESKADDVKKTLPVFGNYYNFCLVRVFTKTLFCCWAVFSAGCIIYKYWTKTTRIYFIFGSLMAISSYLIWIFWLGKLIYPPK